MMFKVVSCGAVSLEKRPIEHSLASLDVDYKIEGNSIIISKPVNEKVLPFLGLHFSESTIKMPLSHVSMRARELTTLNQKISTLENFFGLQFGYSPENGFYPKYPVKDRVIMSYSLTCFSRSVLSKDHFMIESLEELRKVVSFINDQLELKEDLETLFPGSVEILQGSQKASQCFHGQPLDTKYQDHDVTFFHALKLNLRGVHAEQFFNTVFERLQIKDYRGEQKLCAGAKSTAFDKQVADIVKKLDTKFRSEGMLVSAYHKGEVQVVFNTRHTSVQIGLFCYNPYTDLNTLLPGQKVGDVFFDKQTKIVYIRLLITDAFYASSKSSQFKYKALRDFSIKHLKGKPVTSFRTFTNLSETAIQKILPVFKLLSRFNKLQQLCKTYGVKVNLDPSHGLDLYIKDSLQTEFERLSNQLMLKGNAVVSLYGLKVAISAYKAPAPFARNYLNQLYDKSDVLAIDISSQDPHAGGVPVASAPDVLVFVSNTSSLSERFDSLKSVRQSLALDTQCPGLEAKFNGLDDVVQQKIQEYDGSAALGYYSQRMCRVTLYHYERLVYALKINKESFSGSVYEKLSMKMGDFSGCTEGLSAKVESLIPSSDEFGLVDLRKAILLEEITKDGHSCESSEAMASVSYHLRHELYLGEIPKPDNFWVSEINSIKYVRLFREHYSVARILDTALGCFSSRLDDMIRADHNGDLVMNVDDFLLDLGVREEEKNTFLNEFGDIDYQFLKLCLPYYVMRCLLNKAYLKLNF